jgi:glycosyltransferase involved in cell wall biosynthesis
LPVEVIPPGVDAEYYFPQKTACNPLSLVYLGNFNHSPNVDSALLLVNEILPRVRALVPGVCLSIVGAEPTPEISALAAPDEVIVTGWVEDTRLYLAEASLAVFPIRLGVGIRNKILESMAMGKAVVTTPLGAAGLHPRHGENIWVASSVEDFAQAIVTLLRDPPMAARMGLQAREFIEREYSWSAAAARQTLSYDRVLAERDAQYSHRRYTAFLPQPFYRPIGRRLGYLTTALAYGVVLTRGLPYLAHAVASRGKPNPFQSL